MILTMASSVIKSFEDQSATKHGSQAKIANYCDNISCNVGPTPLLQALKSARCGLPFIKPNAREE